MIFPTLEEAKNLAKQCTIIPVCKTILADTETPVSVWLKLFKNEPYSFLLESVTGDDVVARYSFIGGDPFMIFRSHGAQWSISGSNTRTGSSDPIGALRGLLANFSTVRIEGLPRFAGGAVGFVSYDSIRLWENIPDKNPKKDPLDDIFFGFYKNLIVFDSREQRLMLISNMLLDEEISVDDAYQEALYAIGTMEDRMAVRLVSSQVSIKPQSEPESNFSKDEYEKAVERCKEYIRDGDIFQVVLSQRFSLSVDSDPFDLYRILRVLNPSPYMYYLSLEGHSVIGASPEMLVRVEDGMVENRPIAGTRKRGKDETEDEEMIEELKHDPKEIAEHIMLVDLGRNDIGRISEYGSVSVEEMMHIEKYSHVMHLVSNVHGKLKKGCDAFDALYSCFPAGTLSGAPKIRAMEIIDELEPVKRGIYGGALGYIDFGGTMDTCIVIRTIVYHNDTAYIQAGAGIVADSVPAREYQETVDKAKALFSAIKNAKRITG